MLLTVVGNGLRPAMNTCSSAPPVSFCTRKNLGKRAVPRRRAAKKFPLPVARIAKAAVLANRLGIVAALAQCLPVALVPEQIPVSTVRHDVVDDRGGNRSAEALARRTQRMQAQVQGACLAPPGIVTARCS